MLVIYCVPSILGEEFSSCAYSFQETTELIPKTSRDCLILISYLLTTLNVFVYL